MESTNELLNSLCTSQVAEKHNNRQFKTFCRNQYYLIITNLLSFREDWPFYLLMVCITPITLMLFLSFYFGKNSNDVICFIITGNMVMSLVTGTMLTLGQNLAFLKAMKGLDYYATLPVRKISLIIAFVTKTTILSIPSLLAIFIFAYIFFGIQFTIHPVIILIVFLSGYALSGFGAIIGVYSKDIQVASMLTQILQPVIVFLAPVMIPEKSLPVILQKISYLIPTRYVANALRAAFNNKVSYVDLLIMFLVSLVSIYLVGFKLDWRKE